MAHIKDHTGERNCKKVNGNNFHVPIETQPESEPERNRPRARCAKTRAASFQPHARSAKLPISNLNCMFESNRLSKERVHAKMRRYRPDLVCSLAYVHGHGLNCHSVNLLLRSFVSRITHLSFILLATVSVAICPGLRASSMCARLQMRREPGQLCTHAVQHTTQVATLAKTET